MERVNIRNNLQNSAYITSYIRIGRSKDAGN